MLSLSLSVGFVLSPTLALFTSQPSIVFSLRGVVFGVVVAAFPLESQLEAATSEAMVKSADNCITVLMANDQWPSQLAADASRPEMIHKKNKTRRIRECETQEHKEKAHEKLAATTTTVKRHQLQQAFPLSRPAAQLALVCSGQNAPMSASLPASAKWRALAYHRMSVSKSGSGSV